MSDLTPETGSKKIQPKVVGDLGTNMGKGGRVKSIDLVIHISSSSSLSPAMLSCPQGTTPKEKVILALYGVKDSFLNPLMGDENKASSFRSPLTFASQRECETESTSVGIQGEDEDDGSSDEPQEPQSVLSATAKAVEEEYSLVGRHCGGAKVEGFQGSV